MIDPIKMIEHLVNVNEGNENLSEKHILHRVLHVYHITHRFTFQRLEQFIKNPGFLICFMYYLEISKLERLHEHRFNPKFRDNYYEVVRIIFDKSPHRNKLVDFMAKFYNNKMI